MASYYKRINGKNYDRKMLESADEKSGPEGKKKISLKDAKIIMESVKDGGRVTEIEQRTLSYILENYSFSEAALKWFEAKLSEGLEPEPSAGKTAKPAKKKASAPKSAKKKPAPEPLHKEQEEHDEEYIEEHDESSYIPQNEEPESAGEGGAGKFLFFLAALLLIIAALFFFLRKDKPAEQPGGTQESEDAVKESTAKESTDTVSKEEKSVEEEEVKAPESAGDGKFYIVKDKDTLISISRELYGDFSRWQEIYRLNKETVEKPSVIFPGQKLRLPE